MSPLLQKKIVNLLKKYPSVTLVYLFGSRARGDAGPLSDFDFAVYADEYDRKKLSELQLSLISALSKLLKTDAIDVLMLNTVEQPEIKYAAISEGKIIYERRGYATLIEPRIINEYCDFRMQLKKYGLTRDV